MIYYSLWQSVDLEYLDEGYVYKKMPPGGWGWAKHTRRLRVIGVRPLTTFPREDAALFLPWRFPLAELSFLRCQVCLWNDPPILSTSKLGSFCKSCISWNRYRLLFTNPRMPRGVRQPKFSAPRRRVFRFDILPHLYHLTIVNSGKVEGKAWCCVRPIWYSLTRPTFAGYSSAYFYNRPTSGHQWRE